MGDSLLMMGESDTAILYEAGVERKNMYSTLTDMYRRGTLCDVTLKVGYSRIHAHRAVLAAGSDYFRAMFIGGMSETQQKVVTIRDMDEHALRLVIDFIYTGRIGVDVSTVQDIVHVASVLQLDYLASSCLELMSRHLHPSNCLAVRQFADQHGYTDLVQAAERYTADHFLQVASSDDLVKISLEQMMHLVRSPYLLVDSEGPVLEALLRWVRSDQSRRRHLPSLLSHVRLQSLPISQLLEISDQHEDLLRQDINCRDIIDTAIRHQLAQMGLIRSRSCSQLLKLPSSPRLSCSGVLFCVGGRGDGTEPFNSVECYDPRENKWFMAGEMGQRRRHVGVAPLGRGLLAVGGVSGHAHLSSVEKYNVHTSQWSSVQPMHIPRRGVGVVSMSAEGPVYAIGGLDDNTTHKVVERYDPVQDRWSFVSSLITQRGGLGVTAYQGRIYAIGGSLGPNSLSSCEKYDPQRDKWEAIASMKKKRAGAGVAAIDGYIYAVGGFDNDIPLASAERYDPNRDQWEEIPTMGSPRGGVGVAVLGGKLFAVGGHSGQGYLNSVEMYDPLSERWVNIASISLARAGCGVVWVDTLATSVYESLNTFKPSAPPLTASLKSLYPTLTLDVSIED